MKQAIHDFAAIGVGPFNLSLACLSEAIPDLDGIFIDEKPAFEWHPGLLLPRARMQTPFMNDLVTPADPTNRFSFLNFLKAEGRLQAFLIRGDLYPLRRDFNAYCRWCAAQLPRIRFGERVNRVSWDAGSGAYRIHCSTRDAATGQEYLARKLVLGTGTTPAFPAGAPRHLSGVSHSAEYLKQRSDLLDSRAVTVVGGGQSGAEIFLDLLLNGSDEDCALTWVTRSGHFFATEDTKFALELSTPAYSMWFQGLPEPDRHALLAAQTSLHKGARLETLEEIFDVLYARGAGDDGRIELRTDSTLESITPDPSGAIRMTFLHGQGARRFQRVTDRLVLATGYANHIPAAIDGVSDRIRYDDAGRIAVAQNYSIDQSGHEIFMHNNDFYSHGISVFDLGMVCHRNTEIINALAERPVYSREPQSTFQQFRPPESETGDHPDRGRPAP